MFKHIGSSPCHTGHTVGVQLVQAAAIGWIFSHVDSSWISTHMTCSIALLVRTSGTEAIIQLPMDFCISGDYHIVTSKSFPYTMRMSNISLEPPTWWTFNAITEAESPKWQIPSFWSSNPEKNLWANLSQGTTKSPSTTKSKWDSAF